MPSLTDLFNADAISLNYTEAATNAEPMLGKGFFPSVKKAGLDLSWLVGYNGLPVSLMPSTFDAKATFRDRVGVSKLETEMPFFREAMLIKEKDRQEILRVESSSDPFAMQVIEHVFDDARNLIDGAEVVAERMRMQLLAPLSGNVGISINANNVDYTYNYDPSGEWKASHYAQIVTDADKWTASATAKPLEDIKNAIRAQKRTGGATPKVLLMSQNTFDLLANAESVRAGVLAKSPNATIFYTDEIVRSFIEELFNVSIVVYDKYFIDETKNTKAYYPDNIIMMMPAEPVGKTAYGTTPEELDGEKSGADVRLVNTGVAVMTLTIPHPVNVETIVSEIVLPTFERLNDCYAIEVA